LPFSRPSPPIKPRGSPPGSRVSLPFLCVLKHPPPIFPASCARIATVDRPAFVFQPPLSSRLPFPPPASMELWGRSSITSRRLEGLVRRGLLRPLSAVQEWLLPGDEGEPVPPEGYVVSFAIFHERGFGVPAHRFLRGLLDFYEVELQHLTPNGIQHMAAFVALCEGFLGIDPHFDLWRYFFSVSLSKRKIGGKEVDAPMGCASIHLRHTRSKGYPYMRLATSNKGWHSQWFYVRDDVSATLPKYTGRLIVDAPASWGWGVQTKDKKHISDLLSALHALKGRGVKGSGIIGAYHARRVAPLMARVLPLHRMTPGMSFEGTVLVDEALPYSEVAQRVKEATEPTKDSAGRVLDIVYPVPGHPPMRPEPGFFEFVSPLLPHSFLSPESPSFNTCFCNVGASRGG